MINKSVPKKRIVDIYNLLYKLYGPQGWWPLVGHSGSNPTKSGAVNGYHPADYSFPKTDAQRFEICVGAILTQNTAWPNVEKALLSLDSSGLLSPSKLLAASEDDIAACIKPAGYFNQKTRKLKIFARFYMDLAGTIPSREQLLGIWGIGPETADSMLLYAYGVPSFVIDAYTKRIAINIGLASQDADYDSLKALFENALPRDTVLYQEYHALIVEHAKRYYRKKELYAGCPLLQL